MKSGSTDPAKWVSAGAVVQGATHIRQNKICQDALYVHKGEDKPFAFVCVADGHGSERCPFSDEGAAAAVRVTAEILSEILESGDPKGTLTAQKDIRLPKLLEKEWKNAVKKIHEGKVNDGIHSEKAQPGGIQPDEVHPDGANSDDADDSDTPDPAPPLPPFSYELYGSTLLALAATLDFVFALQLGDGDAVAIDPDGSARWLLPPSEHAGNETESLCMDDSWKYIRTQLIPLDGSAPDNEPTMLLISTDGYANSFVTGAGFLKAGADIYRLWRENGCGYIEENLSGWLTHTSANGSGDDIAAAIIAKDMRL
ncbi:MAG: protein phosphatase 2C domain-containing protein [Defluviitaleaceae bacterium]|nr:protein phosphatase 2C domain-containing protein [Defluviitaleaceae bacterium]